MCGAAGGARDLVYIRLPDKTTKGIPAWMFDPVVCGNVRSADRPLIECSALLKLTELLDMQTEESRTAEYESAANLSSKSGLHSKGKSKAAAIGQCSAHPAAAKCSPRKDPAAVRGTASVRRRRSNQK